MNRAVCNRGLFPALILSFLFSALPAPAFYEWQGDDSSVDITGMTQIYGMVYRRPENPLFYRDNDRSGIAGIGRVIIDGQAGESFTFEANAYQTYIPMELATGRTTGGVTVSDVERSSSLEWSAEGDNYIHTALDRLNLRWSKDRLDLIIGRQPINLATNFYFTPNDFFAPFAAQTFYRVYKPGVDAARAEVRLGDLSQLSLIGVLGYDPDKDSDTGWGGSPEPDRASYLARISGNIHEFEWAVLAGSLAASDVAGASMQGEFFRWLGVKAEGHMAWPEDTSQGKHAEISIGIEHYWENSLDLRIEFFYHGGGASHAFDYTYATTTDSSQGLYLGRRYSALGIGYEFTPLLNGQMVLIGNLADSSLLASFNAVYSLSNESELSLDLAIPAGKDPDGTDIKSEFGMYPYTLDIEWRWYF